MFKKLKQSICICLLLVVVISSSGCVALFLGAAAGAGGVYYFKGNLEKNYDYSVSQVHDSVLAALKSLGTFIKEDELNKHSAAIKFEFEDGTKGRVEVIALTERASKLKVRIGVFGDEEKSRKILNEIEKNM